MAPPTLLHVDSIEKPKGKTVRFADDEGHDLCEVFHFEWSLEYNHRPLQSCASARKAWIGQPAVKTRRRKPMELCDLSWNHDQLFDRVERLNLSVENIVKTQKGIIGMVAVKNIAFCKDVSIIFTFDDWQTHRETRAAFYRQDEIKDIDYFVFIVSDKAACFEKSWELNFAVRYKVNGREFWDNNDEKNYRVFCD